MDHDRMDVFCQLPCVVEYAGLFVVVVRLLVSNACGMAVMVPWGPVWPALICTVSEVVEVARAAGGGIGRVALSTRLGMLMQW